MIETVLNVKDIVLNYGSQTVVNHVSFEMRGGRILALIGPNGAGKSSALRVLAGLVKPEKGQIYLNGKILPAFRSINQNSGFFIESPDFYKNLTAIQNLNLLQKVRGKKQTVSSLLEMVGLMDVAHKKVGKFSKGMKQRLGIAQALIGDPEILVLDEPFHGLDPEVKMFLMKLIRKLAAEENKAILVSSHLLLDLESIADDFVLLNKGRIHLAGKLSDYDQNKQKVTFWFNKDLSENLTDRLENGKIKIDNKKCWEANLTREQTSSMLQTMVNIGLIPYEIDREDLLHSKYMEIIE